MDETLQPQDVSPARAASSLIYIPRIRDLLKTQRIHAAVDYKGLTVAFLPNRDFPEPMYGGMDNFLGNAHCAGIRVIKPGETFDEAYKDAQQKLDALIVESNLSLRENTRVAVLTFDDIARWISFENEVKAHDLDAMVGERIWSESGLRRLDPERFTGQQVLFANLLSQQAGYLESQGVWFKEMDNEWSGVGVFLGGDTGEDITPIPVYNIKIGSMKRGSEVLTEKILMKPVQCAAVVVRQIGESKREAYSRAAKVKKFLKQQYGWQDIEVPVISAGQITAWNKLGFGEAISTWIPNNALTWKEVVRYTHLDDDNMHPGPFAQAGISLFPNSHEFNVDGVFTRRVGFDHEYATIDGIKSVVVEGKSLVIKTIDNVGAIIVIPEDIDPEYLKKNYIEPAQELLKHPFGKKVNIALVTKHLLEDVWEIEGPFEEIEETSTAPEASFLSARRPRRSTDVRQDIKYGLHLPRTQSQVGALPTLMNVGDDVFVFDPGPSQAGAAAYSGIIGQTRTSTGMEIGLTEGTMVQFPNLYNLPRVILTSHNLGGLFERGNDDVTSSYLLSELRHRLTDDDMVNLFGQEEARRFFPMGRYHEQIWYGGHNYALAGIILSHAHVDHIGDLPLLDEPKYGTSMSSVTRLFLHWQSVRASSSLKQPLYIADPNQKIGSAYAKVPRDIHTIDTNAEVIRYPNGFWYQPHFASHSLEGAQQFLFGFPNGVTVYCSGDLKSGPETDAAAHLFAGRPDVIKIEATNLPESNKASAYVTEDVVFDSLLYHFSNAGESPILVEIAPNNIDRFLSVIVAATQCGRQVAVDPSIAELLEEISGAQKEQGYMEGLDMPIPNMSQLGLYVPNMTQERPYVRALRVVAEQNPLGVVDPKRLLAESNRWVVITTPYRKHAEDLKIAYSARGILIIHSAPFPYEQDAKDRVGANYAFAQRLRGKYIADFSVQYSNKRTIVRPDFMSEHPVHASGHFPFFSSEPDPNNPVKIQSTVDMVKTLLEGRSRQKTYIIIDHTEAPGVVAQALKTQLKKAKVDLRNVKFPNVEKYDPKKPWGHWILDCDW